MLEFLTVLTGVFFSRSSFGVDFLTEVYFTEAFFTESFFTGFFTGFLTEAFLTSFFFFVTTF
jgi:hypothetical protein